jgi:tetratricopeptide (TPR) repeat protein
MKRLILVVVCVGVIGGAALYLNRQQTVPVAPTEPAVTAAPSQPMEDPQAAAVGQQKQAAVSATTANPGQAPAAAIEASPAAATNATPFSRILAALISPQTSFKEKQALWKQLRESGELDQAIAALKAGMAANPNDAAYPAALGEAYINQLITAKQSGNYNEIAILALQADQSFDAALKLNPSNWEAQYNQAASLAYWPPEMNKGPEVIQRLSGLIDQQEALPSQPQFALTYVLLGEQYQRSGQSDYAVQTWKLGAARVPDNAALRKKISGAR